MSVVPLATAAARATAGRAVHPFTFGWLVLAVVLGIALPRYSRRLGQQVDQEHDDQLAADCHRAFLGGQNAVAMGASSVVDAIEGVIPVLGQPPPGSALWALAAGWKADLGMSTAGTATYLLVALRQWEAAHNRHPDLSTYVNLYLPEGQGTVLLTASQVALLSAILSAMTLQGTVRVRLRDLSVAHRPPGGAVRLDIEGHLVELAADDSRSPRPVDPGPISFIYIAAFLARGVAPSGEHVPISVAAGGVAMCLIASLWSHARLRKVGSAARPSILLVAVGVALTYTILASLTMRNLFTPDGDRSYGFAAGLLLLAFLAGYYHESLTPSQRAKAFFGAGVVWVVGSTLPGGPSTLLSLLLGIPFAITPYPPCLRLSQELERAGERHAREAKRHDASRVSAAFAQGSAEVMAMVWRARDEAYRQLDAVSPTLQPVERATALSRLKEVDRRLNTSQPRSA